MKLSVIIPLYNQEKFIKKCLLSCIRQGLKHNEYEIIVVNDGSTDNSLKIAQDLQKSHPNIIIIDKKVNEGVESARYSGYKNAKGEYIVHVDSDDWLEPKILSETIFLADKYKVDYVCFSRRRVLGTHIKVTKKFPFSKHTGYIDLNKIDKSLYISFFLKNELPVHVTGKLYRHSTLDEANIELFGITMGEDLLYNLQLFPFLNSIYLLDKVGYNYRWGGLTTRFNPYLWCDLKRIYKYKMSEIQKFNYDIALFDPLKMELSNILKSEISQLILYNKCSRSNIEEFIKKELSDDIWIEALTFYSNLNNYNDEFIKLLLLKDPMKLYEFCENDVLYNKRKNYLKKKIFTFLNSI